MAVFSRLHQDLATADRHIAEGEARVARQAKVMRELDADGHDTEQAQALLEVMQRNLDLMNAHRQQIVRELASLQGEEL